MLISVPLQEDGRPSDLVEFRSRSSGPHPAVHYQFAELTPGNLSIDLLDNGLLSQLIGEHGEQIVPEAIRQIEAIWLPILAKGRVLSATRRVMSDPASLIHAIDDAIRKGWRVRIFLNALGSPAAQLTRGDEVIVIDARSTPLLLQSIRESLH